MTTDDRALCAELLEDAAELADLMQGVIDGDYAPDSLTLQPIRGSMARARAALAQPEPEGPTDEEIDALLPLGMASYSTLCGPREIRGFARDVLARWGRQPAPDAAAP